MASLTTPRSLGAERSHAILLMSFPNIEEKVIFFNCIGKKCDTIDSTWDSGHNDKIRDGRFHKNQNIAHFVIFLYLDYRTDHVIVRRVGRRKVLNLR